MSDYENRVYTTRDTGAILYTLTKATVLSMMVAQRNPALARGSLNRVVMVMLCRWRDASGLNPSGDRTPHTRLH